MNETKVQRHTQHWICLLLLKFNKHQSSLIFLFVILHCVLAPDYYIGPLYTLCYHCILVLDLLKIFVFFFWHLLFSLCVCVFYGASSYCFMPIICSLPSYSFTAWADLPFFSLFCSSFPFHLLCFENFVCFFDMHHLNIQS